MVARKFEVGTSLGKIVGQIAEGEESATILLLHGVTRGWRDWGTVLPMLAYRWRPLAIDFRGHGGSFRAADRYRVVDYAEEVTRILMDSVKRPAVVIGHSLGAMVALAVAARLPSQVRALVLEDPPFETLGARIRDTPFLGQFRQYEQLVRQSPRPSVDQLARQLADVQLADPTTGQSVRLGDRRDAAALRFHAACLARLDPEVLEPLVAGSWLEDFDWRTLARDVRCPTLLLQADPRAGGMLTIDDANDLCETLADVTFVRFPGIPHGIHSASTERFLSVVIPFLDSLGGDGLA